MPDDSDPELLSEFVTVAPYTENGGAVLDVFENNFVDPSPIDVSFDIDLYGLYAEFD